MLSSFITNLNSLMRNLQWKEIRNLPPPLLRYIKKIINREDQIEKKNLKILFSGGDNHLYIIHIKEFIRFMKNNRISVFFFCGKQKLS